MWLLDKDIFIVFAVMSRVILEIRPQPLERCEAQIKALACLHGLPGMPLQVVLQSVVQSYGAMQQ
jgi:hypothetical protein